MIYKFPFNYHIRFTKVLIGSTVDAGFINVVLAYI